MTHRWYGDTMRHFRPEYPSECPDDQFDLELVKQEQRQSAIRRYYARIGEAVTLYMDRGYRVCADPGDDSYIVSVVMDTDMP